MKSLITFGIVLAVTQFSAVHGVEKEVKDGYVEIARLMRFPDNVVQFIYNHFPNTNKISEARDVLKTPNVPRWYLRIFEQYFVALVEHKNDPEWKERFAALLDLMELPSENIGKFKQIAPDALPSDHAVRKKLLLDSGFDQAQVDKIDPYLEFLEDMEY